MQVIVDVLHCCTALSKDSSQRPVVVQSRCAETDGELSQDSFFMAYLANILEGLYSQKSELCIPQGGREWAACLELSLSH